ncbi:NADH-quinone oxidoreductase subunit A [Flocculibacter collagenilyticus]
MLDQSLHQLWPIAIYFISVTGLLIGVMVASHYIGPKTKGRETDTPYESGIVSLGSARVKFSNHFFLYAIFFVIFDLETVFLFAWVIAFQEAGILGLIEAFIFIAILLAALVYLWKIGALDVNRRHSKGHVPYLTASQQPHTASKHQAQQQTPQSPLSSLATPSNNIEKP